MPTRPCIPLGVAKSSTRFGLGKRVNDTSAGWQVTLCAPVWHMSSRGGEARCILPTRSLYLLRCLDICVLSWVACVNKSRSCGHCGGSRSTVAILEGLFIAQEPNWTEVTWTSRPSYTTRSLVTRVLTGCNKTKMVSARVVLNTCISISLLKFANWSFQFSSV